MSAISSFSDIIGLWETAAHFGRDAEIPATIAANMSRRNSISGEYFKRVVKAAHSIGRTDITHELLGEIAERTKVARKKKRKVAHG